MILAGMRARDRNMDPPCALPAGIVFIVFKVLIGFFLLSGNGKCRGAHAPVTPVNKPNRFHQQTILIDPNISKSNAMTMTDKLY